MFLLHPSNYIRCVSISSNACFSSYPSSAQTIFRSALSGPIMKISFFLGAVLLLTGNFIRLSRRLKRCSMDVNYLGLVMSSTGPLIFFVTAKVLAFLSSLGSRTFRTLFKRLSLLTIILILAFFGSNQFIFSFLSTMCVFCCLGVTPFYL